MEDDDEFGDLYTDILKPSSSSSPKSLPVFSLTHPIIPSRDRDDNEIIHKTTNFDSCSLVKNLDIILNPEAASAALPRGSCCADAKIQGREVEKDEDRAIVSSNLNSDNARVLENGNVEDVFSVDRKCQGESWKDGTDREGTLLEKHVDFGDEDKRRKVEDAETKPTIPGLSIHLAPDVTERKNVNFRAAEEVDAREDDWESDSDDGLQIVLNDSTHDSMALDGGLGGSEDEEGEPLVIVADGNQSIQPEQEWPEDVAQPVDVEKKDTGEIGKASGGTSVLPKVGYSGHGYHPYHSQFKYVRPGSTPTAGAPSVGPGISNQVRPPVTIGTVSGRGRVEWRPPGIKSTSAQKNFHSGFGLPWGNSMPSRGFGAGLEFTLPSHKTIFEVDVDSFEEKPWKLPAIDLSDFFNFNLNEDSWKEYCKQLEQLRLEATMQSKIRVYESGRAEKDYDPDLPPELAAAVGIHDVTAENLKHGNVDSEIGDEARGSMRVRPPLPTGRAIQVEGGYGERLPSIDTRPPRVRDSDAIIEIVLQESVDDDNPTQNGFLDRPDSESQTEDCREGFTIGNGNREGDNEGYVESPYSNSSIKRDLAERDVPAKIFSENNLAEIDRVSPLPPDNSKKYHPDIRIGTSLHITQNFNNLEAEWETSGEKGDIAIPQQKSLDSKDEEPDECEGAKWTPSLSSPISKGSVGQNSEIGVGDHVEQEPSLLEKAAIPRDDTLPKVKKQKLSSQVGQPVQEIGNLQDPKSGRSNEVSKGRPGYRKEYRKCRNGIDEDIVQDQHSTYPKKSHPGTQRHVVDRKQESGRNREEPRKSIHVDRQKEREMSSLHLDRKDHDARGRSLDVRKREYGSEVGSRDARRNEIDGRRDSVRSEIDGRRRDDGRNVQSVSAVDHNRNRRRDEDLSRGVRDHKREGHDASDTRKRIDEPRKRENINYHNVDRFNDDTLRQKARNDRHRERERDEPRRPEDQARGKHSDMKVERSGFTRDFHRGHDGEQSKDRERHVELRHRGSQPINEDRRSAHEKATGHNDRTDSRRLHERRRTDDTRQNKEPAGGVQQISSTHAKKNHAGQISNLTEVVGESASSEREKKDENTLPRNISLENSNDVSSGDEQKRGRSKLERWGSHSERESDTNPKSEGDGDTNLRSSDQPPKATEIVEERETEAEKHMDTVAKLKKRSERFKLPMPGEKEIMAVKRMESEALPSAAPSEPITDSSVKHERPARKRRWVGN